MNNYVDENKYLKDIISVYKSGKKENSAFKLEDIKPVNAEEDSSNTDLESLSSEEKFNAIPKYKAEKDNLRFRIINQYLLSSPSPEDYGNNKARLEQISTGKPLNIADLNWIRGLMNIEPLK
jgi:hypothetical protein